MLFDPAAHEPLTELVWNDAAVRAAIAAVAADAQAAFDPDDLWAPHPLDELDDAVGVCGLYLGASGAIWALHRLEKLGAVELRRDWASVARSLPERYAAQPDLAEELGGPVPSLWLGEAGILLVAHTLAPAAEHKRPLLDAIRRNAENPTRELILGSPGTMLAAHVMWERTAEEEWLEAWRASADWLWDEWRDDLWRQELAGRSEHRVDAAHGFVGNVFVLARGDLLDRERRRELEERTIAALRTYARREEGLAQWPTRLGGEGATTTRTQWCHGAPGIVSSVALLAPGDAELTELLAAGGELTWHAGPLVKGAGLCHGTAGNGYAFLKLFERTATRCDATARGASRCTRSSRSSARGRRRAAFVTRSGRATSARRFTCRAASTRTPRFRRSTSTST